MIELLLLLFVIPGDTSDEWLQSCYGEFNPNLNYFLPLRGFDPSNQTHVDSVFCRTVLDLYLDEYDLEKLGRNLDWSNYVIQTTIEFLDNYDFYQEYGIKDTLEIKPIIGLRDLNPRDMKVVISFDYVDGISIYYYEEIFDVHPLCDPPISYDGVCNLKITLSASPTSIVRNSDISPRPNLSHQYELSLKQQINENLSFNEILCPNNNHVLAERTNGKLSCVYYETAEKLKWTIRDKEVKINLLLNDDPAVKDCVPKGPDDVYPTMPYRNSTHSFDVGVCEWSEK